MSTTYPTLTETNFPDSVDSFTRMSDISYADISLVNQYNEYILAGNTSAANQILIDNPSLENKIMNASNMNKILDALSAIQQFFKNNVQTYIDDKSDVIQEQIDNFTDKGNYSGATTYIANNIVSYNGEGYICKQESTGNLPTNTNYFTKIASRGVQGASGTGLTWRGNYSAEINYYKDDCVTDGNKIWAALQNSTGQALIEGTYWTVAISIDSLMGEKENKHSTVNAELTFANWTNMTQTISVLGVTTDNTVFISPAPVSQDMYSNSGIYCTSQSAGSLIFTCKSVPSTDLTVNIVILGG